VCLQVEIEKLKVENDRLKVENQGSRMGSQASVSSSPPRHHAHGQAQGTGPGLSQHSLNLTTSESTSLGTNRLQPNVSDNLNVIANLCLQNSAFTGRTLTSFL